MKKDEALINTLNQQIKYLADSVTSLSQAVNETLDTTVGLTRHVAQLQQDFITILNRLNEIELTLENQNKEPLVMPVVKRKRTMEVKTPYPRKNNHLKRLYYGLRRIVKHAST
jgi:uncharacterized UPF0160 family protein